MFSLPALRRNARRHFLVGIGLPLSESGKTSAGPLWLSVPTKFLESRVVGKFSELSEKLVVACFA
jgi:hypothetical protein